MLEILQFVFSSFWVWSGTVILIAVCAMAVSEVIPRLTVTWRTTKQ